MPVFDDPRRELQRLQQELLAEEDEELDDLMEEYADEDYENYFQEDYEDEYEQEPFYRKQNNGYRSDSLYVNEDDEDEEEPYALFKDEKRRGRGLRILLLLEIIGILCVLIWWVVMQL